MRLAVSGATGFVGGHVVRALRQRGIDPVLMVRPGREIKGKLAGLEAVEIDFAYPPEDALDRLGKPDVLIHLAWGGLPDYRAQRHLTDELPMHSRLLESLLRAGLQRLVVAGTCFEYGMQSGELHEQLPTTPDNPYGQAKDRLRQHLGVLQQQVDFELVWARLFYMYGDDQPERSLYQQLRRAASSGEPVFPMSGGEQVRDYLRVEDVASCLVELALMRGDMGVVNVCSGEPVTVLNLVERWVGERGWAIKPQVGVYPYPDYEPMRFWGSRSRLDTFLQRDAGH